MVLSRYGRKSASETATPCASIDGTVLAMLSVSGRPYQEGRLMDGDDIIDTSAVSGLDFRLLNQFLNISRSPNMAAAARKMSLSAPAVSQIVRRLETELGVALFERSSRGIRLTPAGVLLQQRARNLVDAEADMLEALAPYRGQMLPKLRVQIASTVANYL